MVGKNQSRLVVCRHCKTAFYKKKIYDKKIAVAYCPKCHKSTYTFLDSSNPCLLRQARGSDSPNPGTSSKQLGRFTLKKGGEK